MGMDNPTSPNANSNLVLDSRAIELLTQPLGVKGLRLLDAKVGAINSNLALRAVVSNGAVVPSNLWTTLLCEF